MQRVKDKVALVTGVAGPKGMGYAIAKTLAREGAVLAVADISDEVYNRAKEMQVSGYKVVPFKVDLTKSKEVNQMVDKVLEQFGRVDILVNVAGIGPRRRTPRGPETDISAFKLFVDMTEKEWDSQIAINLKTNFNCTKAVFPGMIKQRYGKIINISSTSGNVATEAGTSAYSAAKAGVAGLTMALALEAAQYGINVNAIAPGWTDTGREIEREAGKTSPMKRAGTPQEIANLVLFLASDESTYLTGQLIVNDGGNTIQEYKGAGEVPGLEV